MEPIGITAEKIIKGLQNSTSQNKEGILKDGLNRILTRQEQRHIKSYSLRNSRVILGVDSSAWLFMISLKKRRLLDSLKQILPPEEGIIDIRIRLDKGSSYKK